MIKPKETDSSSGIPMHEIEALARCLLPAVLTYYESEDGKQEFENYKQVKLVQPQKENE